MHAKFESKAAASRKYRPEIDGLRGIAILLVVFYHAGMNAFSGGFVGVDIFFVISGYLIAALILRDIANGGFSFISFYERRMRRIFPALFSTVAFCALAAAVMFPPDDFRQFGRSLMAMAGFVSNIFFLRQSGDDGYFDQSSHAQVLLHTWSLSVEEQFYIFFPAALILLKRGKKDLVTAGLLLTLALSFSASIWEVAHQPQEGFYLLGPRIWELLIGALLAIKPPPAPGRRDVREGMALLGLGLIAYAAVFFNRSTWFPGFNALFPCLGAALVIYAAGGGGSAVRTALRFRPLVFIGVISYSLYLWHWPAITFTKYFFSVGSLGSLETTAAVLFSLAAATASFVFIEAPFRGEDSAVTRRQVFGFGIAVSLVAAVLGFTIDRAGGFSERFDLPTRQLILANAARKSDYEQNHGCANYKTELRDIHDIDFCVLGAGAPHKILFWGDSHIEQLHPLIQKIYKEGTLKGEGVVFAIAAGCLPAESMNTDFTRAVEAGYARERFHCDDFSRLAMVRAREGDIDTVFIGASTWWTWPFNEGKICNAAAGVCAGTLRSDEVTRRFLEELSRHIRALKAQGKRVIVALPFPLYYQPIPDLEIHNAILGSLSGVQAAIETTSPALREQIATTAKSAGAEVFDPRRNLCGNQGCLYQKDGVSIYKDNGHIAASQTGLFEKALVDALSKPLCLADFAPCPRKPAVTIKIHKAIQDVNP